MGISATFKGFATIGKNKERIEQLKKGKSTKRSRLAIYMLNGRPVTGAIMIEMFNIYSYRDAIYDLRKDGFEIKSKMVCKNGVEHTIWWLADFEEEFVLKREERRF